MRFASPMSRDWRETPLLPLLNPLTFWGYAFMPVGGHLHWQGAPGLTESLNTVSTHLSRPFKKGKNCSTPCPPRKHPHCAVGMSVKRGLIMLKKQTEKKMERGRRKGRCGDRARRIVWLIKTAASSGGTEMNEGDISSFLDVCSHVKKRKMNDETANARGSFSSKIFGSKFDLTSPCCGVGVPTHVYICPSVHRCMTENQYGSSSSGGGGRIKGRIWFQIDMTLIWLSTTSTVSLPFVPTNSTFGLYFWSMLLPFSMLI